MWNDCPLCDKPLLCSYDPDNKYYFYCSTPGFNGYINKMVHTHYAVCFIYLQAPPYIDEQFQIDGYAIIRRQYETKIGQDVFDLNLIPAGVLELKHFSSKEKIERLLMLL
jgi:hypothetical protein